ncbi:MAG TPA: 5-formyltetrahydrofolate cyclo-ligase, partial [Epulopiscium sp.]|nr:5-formyltetrahydrofolate cyclo-ligase [Candidatus Epulonipiscium sp.]
MDKKQIRKIMKGQRAKVSKDEVLGYSSIIWDKIYSMTSFKSAATLLLYSSIGNEVDTEEIARKALSMGKRIGYPVTDSGDNTMEFHAVNDLNELLPIKTGNFSLLEPKADPSSKIIPDADTLMIVPGLAFDKDLYRTGYGGGF